MAKKETPLSKKKTATLRKLAEEREIEGFEDMERKDLIKALEAPEATEAPEEEESIVTPKKEPVEAPEEEEDEVEEDPEPPKEETFGIEGGRTPIGSKAEIMKAKLAKQPKVTIIIPLEKGEKRGTTFPVTLNRYRLNIQKGRYVKVPKQIARIIIKSQNQTAEALEGETVNLDTGIKHSSRLDGNESELNE